jgi:hypothetical protein
LVEEQRAIELKRQKQRLWFVATALTEGRNRIADLHCFFVGPVGRRCSTGHVSSPLAVKRRATARSSAKRIQIASKASSRGMTR